MMKKAALIAGALLLAGCAGSADSTETAPPTVAATASSASPSTPVPDETEAASPSPSVAVSEALELTSDQRVFVVSARRYWPTASASDNLVLAMGDLACSGLAVSDFDGAVDYVRDMMPAGATLDEATLFTITAVMHICPEYDSMLPG